MPDNNTPSAQPEPSTAPSEFEFAQSTPSAPRLKKRSLKAKKATSELSEEAPPRSAGDTRPEHTPTPEQDADAEINSAVKITEPASSRAYTRPTPRNTSRPPTSTSTPSTSPHGTRPATLYYSSGLRKDKEEPSPMKSTPTAATAATSSTTPLSSTSTRVTTATRPATISDYRTNAERQSREQKSVGNLLSYVVYGLVAMFVIGALLAGYGTYVLSKQIEGQNVTIGGLQSHFEAENKDLTVKLASTIDALSQSQAQISRQQQLIVAQQDTINKLISTTNDNSSVIRQERQVRAQETAAIRARLKDLEYSGTSTRKY